MTNPDVVIKTVEFKILLKKAELRRNPELDCPFSEARQPLYIGGNHEQLSNISEICKQLLINESEESSILEQHDESDDKSERK